jgi:hypothetical protein
VPAGAVETLAQDAESLSSLWICVAPLIRVALTVVSSGGQLNSCSSRIRPQKLRTIHIGPAHGTLVFGRHELRSLLLVQNWQHVQEYVSH